MRVLHVYKFYRPVLGGGITAMESIINGMPGGVQTRVLVADDRAHGRLEPEQERRVRRVHSLGYVYSMPMAPTLPFWFAYESRLADIIHLHLPFPIADMALTLFNPNTPVVVHWHSDIVQQVRTRKLLAPLLRHTLRRADRILVGSPHHVDDSEELGPFRSKCEVVPYGIDVAHWSRIDATGHDRVAQLRKQYPGMVFFAGRLVAYKGLPVLLRAMKSVSGTLVIAGDGPMHAILEKLAAELGIDDRVHFVGVLSDEDLRAHYHACELFVLPSILRNEAFGLVQLEAMACGKPLVNTNLPGGVPWVARNGKEAITVAPDDSPALAAAINRLLADPDLRTRLGAAGYRRVSGDFNIEESGRRVYRIYRELLEGRPRTAGRG